MVVPLLLAAAMTAAITWQIRGLRPLRLDDAFAFTLLLVAAAVSAGLRFGRSEERVSFSFTAVVLLAAIPLVGPVGAVLLGIGAAVLDARQGWWQAWVFNGLMFGLSAAVASWAYAIAGGAVLSGGVLHLAGVPLVLGDQPVRALTAHVGMPLIVADAAFLATNLVVLLTVTPRDPTTPSRLMVVRGMIRTIPTFLAWALVAFVVVVLWGPGGLDVIALVLVTAPLVVTRHMHGLFSAERRTRARLVEAIGGAGRDEGVRAHDDRVARYAASIAQTMGVRAADRTALQAAARLHAVGMPEPCGVDVRADTDRAAAVVQAVTAHEVVGRIGFLAPAATAVRHEGEWFDGSGGPFGLAGESIPLLARILAVADAADALVTSSESARSDVEALARLRNFAGTRFDPEVVSALATSLDVASPASELASRAAVTVARVGAAVPPLPPLPALPGVGPRRGGRARHPRPATPAAASDPRQGRA